MLHPHAWYADKGIRLIAGDPAVRIDRPRKHVYTEKGEVISYDRLILATGSKPFVPPIPGSDLKGVLSFRDIYDVNNMLDYCKTKKNAVVIGGGLLRSGSSVWTKTARHECDCVAPDGPYHGSSARQ